MDPVTQLTDQAALAMLFTWALQGTKSIPWVTWVGDHAPNISRAFSALFAALVAAGFTWTFAGDIVAGGVLTVTVPSLAAIIDFSKTFALQYGGQHVIYKAAFGIKGGSPPPADAAGGNTPRPGDPPESVESDGIPGA
jgi:hypothetical protein